VSTLPTIRLTRSVSSTIAAPGGGALALRAACGYGKLDWDPGYDDKAERERQR